MGNLHISWELIDCKNQCETRYTKKSQDIEKVGVQEIRSNLKVFRCVASRVSFFLSFFFFTVATTSF